MIYKETDGDQKAEVSDGIEIIETILETSA